MEIARYKDKLQKNLTANLEIKVLIEVPGNKNPQKVYKFFICNFKFNYRTNVKFSV